MRLAGLILVKILLVAAIACNNMGDKAGKLAEKAEKSLAETYAATEDAIDRTKEKIDKKLDKLSPTYDADKPDTENNRNRFFDKLKVKPGEDVKEIYCYRGHIDIDDEVLIAFKADRSTIDSIISRKGMNLSTKTHDDGSTFGSGLAWWDLKKVSELKPYRKDLEGGYRELLWYDKKTKKAWYLEKTKNLP